MKYSLVLLAGLGLFQMAPAQTPAHTPPSPAQMAQHEVQHYTTLLSLNSAQVEQATTFFTTEATSRENARANERTHRQALDAAIKAGDTASIQSSANALGQIEAETLTAHATAQAQFYATLNADQKTKYAELEKEHMMGGFEHGPGPR
jgi:Spy/CpxP family protein refolding chaperone